MFERFFSYSGTSVAGQDIKATQWSSLVDSTVFTCNKITFIADDEVSIKVNEATNWCPLYLDPIDTKYKISFDLNDIKIKNFYVNASVAYWVGFLY